MYSSVELKPNRSLLDSNFDGYKLSLRDISTKKRFFEVQVDRVLLSSNQYSILHAKLYGLHNHLIGDEFDENGSVYFVDQDWNINKVYVDSLCDELCDPIKVWQIPKIRDRASGDYNVSMSIISSDRFVIGDGTGFLYILQTGCRDNDDTFSLSFSDEVAGPSEGFVIVDAVERQKTEQELHVLLLSIKQENPNERYLSLLHWVTLTLKNGAWTQAALKQIQTKGAIQYAAIERDCEAVYIVSDCECKIILNSDYPVLYDSIQDANMEIKHQYEWSQSVDNIYINIELPENACKNLVHVVSDSLNICIKYDEKNLITGCLYQRINSEETTWDVKQNELEVSLKKMDTGISWSELIKDDNNGKQIQNSAKLSQVHDLLGLTSEEEVCILVLYF